MKLCNLQLREKSLKCTWAQILTQEREYANFVYKKIHPIGQNVWNCSLHSKDISQLGIKGFWKDVMTAWADFNFQENTYIGNQFLWLNSNIKINNKVVFWIESYKAGLHYVYQLFSNGSTISVIKAARDFKLDFIKFNAIITAIPKHWKTFFIENSRKQHCPVRPTNYQSLISKPKLASHIYNKLIDNENLTEQKRLSWNTELGNNLDKIGFNKLFKEVYTITNVSKFRSFQYRLLNRAITTNTKLYLWNIVESPLCTFCHEYEETVLHVLYLCPSLKEIWDFLQNEVLRSTGEHPDISVENVIFNRIAPKKNSIGNFLCLLTKFYVYKCRCAKTIPKIKELENYFKHVQNIEKYIAMKNGHMSKHIRKWCSMTAATSM